MHPFYQRDKTTTLAGREERKNTRTVIMEITLVIDHVAGPMFFTLPPIRRGDKTFWEKPNSSRALNPSIYAARSFFVKAKLKQVHGSCFGVRILIVREPI